LTLAAAAAAGIAAFLLATGRSTPAGRLTARLAAYVGHGAPASLTRRARSPLTFRRAVAAGTGAAIGALIALAGTGRSAAALAAAGAGCGLLAVNLGAARGRDRHRRALRRELPTVADALALGVLAGEPVGAAIDGFCRRSRGATAGELSAAMERHRDGASLHEALLGAARTTGHADAARLYETLAHAHQTGGRLADRLADLAVDFRAGIARDLTAEGGRRALAVYAPILALQIPVTLLFLIYPTLVGLGELSIRP
jgi:Flp pilus assembly protein TadB